MSRLIGWKSNLGAQQRRVQGGLRARSFLPSLFLLAPLYVACSAPSWKEPVAGGKYKESLQLIAKEKVGDEDEVKELARTMLQREIEESKIERSKERDDTNFIASLRGCSGSMKRALKKRASRDDVLAFEAKMVLLEGGYLSRPGRYKSSEEGALRALAAYAGKDASREQRAEWLVDPDTRVRRAAAHAALEAKDQEERFTLLEVARLDPDALTRSLALRALAAAGGPEVAEKLMDLYVRASEADRLQVASALAAPALFHQGGRERLVSLAEKESGLVGVVAAARLYQALNQEKSDELVEIEKKIALNRLLIFAKDGTQDEARLALRSLPLNEKDAKVRLLVAAKSEDNEVAVIALSRIAGLTDAPRETREALLRIANERGIAADQATYSLALLGEAGVTPLLEQLAKSTAPSSRRVAGQAYLALGDYERLAPLLLDSEASVRRPLACQTLAH